MHDVKFKLVNPALAPRRTKFEMPGWAGQAKPRADGSHEYAWHCAPFTEGAQYGIEIFYPSLPNELRVSKQRGNGFSTAISDPRATCSGRHSAVLAVSIILISFCSI